jgi:hypothetical protein
VGKEHSKDGSLNETQDPAATPQLAELDQLIAEHAFGRAAGALADAAAAASEHNLGKARKLAAEGADHLATAERAQNGLGFRAYPSPARDPSPSDL